MNKSTPCIVVIIPAYNEENGIINVLNDLPFNIIDEVIVVNNNSSDLTSKNALAAGATVLNEKQKGYGYACLKGIAYLKAKEQAPDIVVFLDADYSDHPDELPLLVEPILLGKADLVIGSRALGHRDKGSMTPQQIFGN